MPSNRREIPFAGPAYQRSNVFINAQQSINYYLEPYPALGQNKFALRGCPGLRSWADLGTGKAVRGLLSTGDYAFAVSDNKVFRIDTDGLVTEVGNITASSGYIGMAQGNLQLMIVDAENKGYIYTFGSGAFADITDTAFPGASSVTHQDGIFLVTEPDSFNFYTSDLNDGTTWDSLLFFPANWKSDNLISIFSDHRNVWAGGTESIEIYYNNGNSSGNFLFTRRDGAEMQIGLGAKDSFSQIDNAVFWLGRNENGQGQVFRALGFQPTVVSNEAITEAIANYSDISDAIGFAYLIDKNPMYELTFPTADVTWVYNSSLPPEHGWHERRSRRLSGTRWISGRHRGQKHVFFSGKHLVGDIENGKVYEHTRDVFDEDGTEMEATRSTVAFGSNQDLITVNELQVLFTPGVGLTSGQGSDPVAIISWSGDGGYTWSNEHQVKIGKKGEYVNRAIIRQLGQHRNWVFKVKTTDKVQRDILSGFADIEVDE